MKQRESIQRRILRKLICTGKYRGVLGAAGRWVGRSGYWRLTEGPRIIIDRPEEYIQQHILFNGLYESGVAAVLGAVTSKDQLFLDVGANIGQHTLLAAWRGVDVHAFEAVPRLADRLSLNIAINGLHRRAKVFGVALSNADGDVTLYEADRRDDGSHSLISGVEADRVTERVVRATTIDAHLSQCGRSAATIKIDVEGAESLVLDGATRALEIDRSVVVIETADRLATQIGESAVSVLQRLTTRDYRLFKIDDRSGAVYPVPLGQVSGELSNYLAIPAESPGIETLPMANCDK